MSGTIAITAREVRLMSGSRYSGGPRLRSATEFRFPKAKHLALRSNT
jgi:hypothetical protein